MTRSFPLTAAGQSRILTGFPLATPEAQAHRRSVRALYESIAGTVKVVIFSRLLWVPMTGITGKSGESPARFRHCK
jgi:hypothetical protein